MRFNAIIRLINNIGTWLFYFGFLNLLWLVFTILGLGLFGFFPATAAVFHVFYKGINRQLNDKIFSNFTNFYKKYFIKSNVIGFICAGVCLFLLLDLRITVFVIQSSILYYLILILIALFFVILLYIFTIMSRYELNIISIFKQSLFIAIAAPIETLAMIFSFIIILLLYMYIPILFFLFGPILIIFPLVWFSIQACIKIENKKIEIK